jgi:hypothetical protein
MSYRIIDYPHFVAEAQYHSILDEMVKRLAKLPEIFTVYQIGGISSPGISDLDLIVIFRDGVSVTQDFLHDLSMDERYLFIHNLYGISHHDFKEAENFTFFNNFTLLYGRDVRSDIKLPHKETEILKRQIAIEYLIKMGINIYLQKSYQALRIRDILLHVKALQYDLDFLGINSGRLPELVSQIIDWRKYWFEYQPSKNDIIKWWKQFHEEFDFFFQTVFLSHKFCLPKKTNYRVAKCITLSGSDEKISFTRNGFLLPYFLSLFGKRYFKLQNRFNTFLFHIPITTENIPEILEKKFTFERKHFEHNSKFLPNFYTLTLNLHVR